MKKKLLCLLVAVMATASLVGCGYDDSSTILSQINCKKYVTALGTSEGLVAYADKSEVTDATVEDYIQYMLYNSKELQETTGRAAKLGDVANIDYVGKKDGVAFDGGTASGTDLELGSGRFIDGFEDGVVGMEIGETKDLNLTFPENYTNTDLAGADVVFTVKLNAIKEYVTPELTDEYVQSLYIEDCNTVADFKKVAKESLESSAEYNYNSDIENQVLKEFTESCTFTEEVPSGLYDYYHNMILENDETQSKSAGMDLTSFVAAYYGIANMDDYYAQIDEGTKKSVKQAMATYLLAKEKNLLVDDKELEQAINDNYEQFGFTSADDFKSMMDSEDYRAYLIEEKVLDYLVENAQVHPTSEKPAEQ